MNRDHDHDIADMLVRKQNSKHYRDCQYANCWCKAEPAYKPLSKAQVLKAVCEEKGIEFIDMPLVRANTKTEDCEGYPQLEEPETTDIDIIRGLVRVIDYHLEAVGDMVCDEQVLATLLTQAKQRLKETKDADIHRDRVSEDRHSELFRKRQDLVGRKDSVDGGSLLSIGDFRWTSGEPDSLPQSCPCPTCSGDG